ncbi:MAG: glycosyltransferase family 9 protein [bacterium]|nr:glycosyltransferase family 9 protein [bacterium]
MSREQLHIGVFYSKGRDFAQALRLLRDANPDAHICAIVPSDLADADAFTKLADDVLSTGSASYSPRNPGPFLGLIQQLRRKRFDRFVVLFPSIRLRGLASLTGAKTCDCLGSRGRSLRLGRHVVPVVVRWVCQKVSGRLLYAGLWLIVYLLPSPRVTPPPGVSESE